MISSLVIPGEGERSDPQTRNEAARESANLSRLQTLNHFAFDSLRRRLVPGLRCASPGMTKGNRA
jgi:hypothetical protein